MHLGVEQSARDAHVRAVLSCTDSKYKYVTSRVTVSRVTEEYHAKSNSYSTVVTSQYGPTSYDVRALGP